MLIYLINYGRLFLLGLGFGIFFAYGSGGGHFDVWIFLIFPWVLIIISVKFKLGFNSKSVLSRFQFEIPDFAAVFSKQIKILFHSELESPIKIYFFKLQNQENLPSSKK